MCNICENSPFKVNFSDAFLNHGVGADLHKTIVASLISHFAHKCLKCQCIRGSMCSVKFGITNIVGHCGTKSGSVTQITGQLV